MTADLHTHFSLYHAVSAFLGIVIIGTGWKLLALHAVSTSNTQLQHLGLAMLFQFGG
jgi:hypothetical protein